MNVTLLGEGSGLGFSLYALTKNDDCPIRDFVSGLEKKDQKQVFALFKFILENGLPTTKERFRKLGDKIFELKTRRGVRIIGFFGGSLLLRSMVFTHGFYKPHARILKRQKEKAARLCKEFFADTDIKKKLKIMEKRP